MVKAIGYSFLIQLILFSLLLSQCFAKSGFQREKCAGRYCGRVSNDSEKCEACPRGYRTNGYMCEKCTQLLKLYEWLYLAFMALISLALHIFFIDYFPQPRLSYSIVLYICAVLESIVAAVVTLLIAEPPGSLTLHSCSAQQLSDWYTVFFNPKPDYINKVYCTQEAVYPLYSIVLIYYAISVLLIITLRLAVSHKLCRNTGKPSIYAALYFLPILTLCQAVFGGLLFYLYPYIALVISIIGTAVVLAKNNIMSIHQLLKSKRHMIILFLYWIVQAFGQIALTELKQPSVDGPMLALVFVPSAFYLVTSSVTEPSKVKM